jgi:hypothetical protein
LPKVEGATNADGTEVPRLSKLQKLRLKIKNKKDGKKKEDVKEEAKVVVEESEGEDDVVTGSESEDDDVESDESNDDFLVPKKVQPIWNDEGEDNLMESEEEKELKLN